MRVFLEIVTVKHGWENEIQREQRDITRHRLNRRFTSVLAGHSRFIF
jgi:hypothetical protein